MFELDFTHDPQRASWVESAGDANTDFPIQNLPFGVYQQANQTPRIGIAIGSQILDGRSIAESGFVADAQTSTALGRKSLNALMALPKSKRVQLRQEISNLLATDSKLDKTKVNLVWQQEVEMLLPCEIRDYTDFYASVYHATNVGSMFRPNDPLLSNYKHIPIGYHGRASSIVVSGTSVKRPVGQKSPAKDGDMPTHSASDLMDYEFEVGFFVAQGNELGTTISLSQAEDRIFGMTLVNDWSARDLQRWEYQPLGPFLAKSFATSISPWVVTMEALAPFRCAEFSRPASDPQPLRYLTSDRNAKLGGVNIQLEAFLSTQKMRQQSSDVFPLGKTSFANMYWTIAQMLTHHSSNGCNMQPGDLLASGTVSGPTRGERGCLLELTWNGDAANPLPSSDRTPLKLPTSEDRKFLADGDEVILRGYCANETHRRIGFGCCRGVIEAAIE